MNDILSQSIDDMFDEFIAHSGKGHDDNPPGRGSGRFPWGSGKNPKQNNAEKYYSPKLSRREKKEAIRKAQKERDEEIRLAKNLKDYTKKEEETVQDEDFNRRKELALKYGQPEDIQRFKGFISNDEYQKAVARIEWERKIDALEQSKIDDAFKKIDKVVGYAGTIEKGLKSANGIYQNSKQAKKNVDDIAKMFQTYANKDKKK